MIRIYLTPFNDFGEFSDEIEVTADVDVGSIGKVRKQLDNSDYDIGILKFGSISLKLQNSTGKYSDVYNLQSIFRFRRGGSKVRVTWAPALPAICGLAVCGQTILAEEVDLFNGILNDDTSTMSLSDQIILFQALSFDSIFDNIVVPFDLLDDTDLMSDILFKTLDQDAFTSYVGLDAGRINLAVDFIPDDLTNFQDQTGTEAIKAILSAANSVIYFEDGFLNVEGREPSEDVKMHFYGQASSIGSENILAITDFRNGQNRIMNFVRLSSNSEDAPVISVQDKNSIDKWGVRSKDVSIEFATDEAKVKQSLHGILGEFKFPRREFLVDASMDAGTLALKLLDQVDFDYPPIAEKSGKFFPVVGVTKIGDPDYPLPYTTWDFKLYQEEKFKIMGFELDLKKEIISLSVRGV